MGKGHFGVFLLIYSCNMSHVICILFDARISSSVLVSVSFSGIGLLCLLGLVHQHRLLEGDNRHLPGLAECPTLGGLLPLRRRLQLESGIILTLEAEKV